MKTYFILSLILYLFYVILKAKKSMHMLQQNWYNNGNRYFKWILDNFEKVFITFDILFAIIIFIQNKYSIIVFACFYVMFYLLLKRKYSKEQSKKPLVITARIKRLYFTMLLLYAIGILPLIFNYKENVIYGYYLYIGLLA